MFPAPAGYPGHAIKKNAVSRSQHNKRVPDSSDQRPAAFYRCSMLTARRYTGGKCATPNHQLYRCRTVCAPYTAISAARGDLLGSGSVRTTPLLTVAITRPDRAFTVSGKIQHFQRLPCGIHLPSALKQTLCGRRWPAPLARIHGDIARHRRLPSGR